MAEEKRAELPKTKEVEVRNILYGPFTVWDAENKPHILNPGEVKKVTLHEKMAGILEKAGHIGGPKPPERKPAGRVALDEEAEKRKR